MRSDGAREKGESDGRHVLLRVEALKWDVGDIVRLYVL
jgi:hypothetical protein